MVKYAFVTLIMYNPQYIYGALVMGHSLKLSKTKHELVCMITDDLYNYYGKYIELVYDRVIIIPYLEYKNHKLYSIKQKEIYNEWYTIAYTKWQCLQLVEYKKICFLDSDLIILNNIDHLFNTPAPAACFVNYWSEFGYTKKNYYKDIKINEKIPNKIVKRGLTDSFTLVAHCVILEPNILEYNQFKQFVQTQFKPSRKCISMTDEQSLASFYLTIGKQWTQLHHVYNTIPWKMVSTNTVIEKTTSIDDIIFNKPYILHYFNKTKPWMGFRNNWTDIEIWYQYYELLIYNTPELNNIIFTRDDIIKFSITNINNFTVSNRKIESCIYCKLLKEIFFSVCKGKKKLYTTDICNDKILQVDYKNIKDHIISDCIYK